MIAELLCAWFAGVVLGWRLGLHHHGINAELHHWSRAVADRDAYDWAKELEL